MTDLGFVKALFIVLTGTLICLYLQGCAHQDSLRVPGVERVCTPSYCFLRASAEIVNARCTKGLRKWDSGQPYKLGDPLRARACTVFRGWGKRYAIWVTEGEEEALAHEFCHVAEFESGRNDHGRCHDFGFGRPKART